MPGPKTFLAALMGGTMLVAACATNGGFNSTTAAAYAQDILSGLTAIDSSTVIRADMGTATTAKVDAALADAVTAVGVLTNVGQAITLNSAQAAVTQIQSDVNIILPLVAAVPGLPASASTVITALQVVLPILLTTVELSAPVSAKAGGMSLSDAQGILKHASL